MEPFKRIGFILFLIAFFSGIYFLGLEKWIDKNLKTSGQSAREKNTLLSFDRAGRLFPKIVERVDPSIVFIHTEGAQMIQPLFGPVMKYKTERSGSGIIFSALGHIVTNAHLAEGSQKITVTLFNKREYNARVVGMDTLTDIMVLKIDAPGLKPVLLGNSDSLAAGQWVLAIGNPMGLSHSVSFGIISALGRQTSFVTDLYEDYIQTDAAINPGNSGGPLINLDAEVIGINTFILSPSQENVGLGFAIPSNIVKWVASSLIRSGRIIRSWLGVELQSLNRNLIEALGLPDENGALISRIFPSSPAATAGLKTGDVVIGMDGTIIRTIHDLRNRVARTGPGTLITLEVVRNKKRLTIRARVEQKRDIPIKPEK